MIYRVFSDNQGFRNVELKKHFNVILADKTNTSTSKDSRNGVGKSSCIEVIHFCLGSELQKDKGLGSEKFKNWTFSMEFDLIGKKVICHRNTSDPKKVFIEGNFPSEFLHKMETKKSQKYFKLEDWRLILGNAFFKLDMELSTDKYSPSFRALISYFVRKEYSKPFEYFRNQPSWQRQIYNSYLLDLSWEYAKEWGLLKDEEKTINTLKKELETPTFSEVLGSQGELEALQSIKEDELREEKTALSSFKVHENYKDIEKDANDLTKKIHELSNKNILDKKMVNFYKDSMTNENLEPDIEEVVEVYNEAKTIISESVKKKIKDIKSFYLEIIENRKNYLLNEVTKIESNILKREEKIQTLSEQRAKKMEVLKTHGALTEFQRFNEIHNKKQSELEAVKNKIEILKKIETSKSDFKIKKEELKKKTREDFQESSEERKKTLSLFNTNSQALYDSSGELIIDISDSGFQFDIKIPRSESSGVGLMKIFCYDLMLSQLWSAKERNPGFLIHDSNMFSDVDERQVISVIEKVQEECKKYNFQYICFLNSDKLPKQLESSKSFKDSVILTLKDKPPKESFFGFRF